MATKVLQITKNYTKQTRRLDHQIQVLQRRQEELESHIEMAKSVTNIFATSVTKNLSGNLLKEELSTR